MAGAALFLLAIGTSAFLLTLLLPPRAGRPLAAVGVVFALGEWFLAYRRSVDLDDAREGLSLLLFTGTFAAAFLLLWLVGVAAALAVRRHRATSRTGP